jgi:hypothetical protein
MNLPYIVQLSNKTEVRVDADELALIAEGIKTASPIRLRKGIINPSFIVCVVEDQERMSEFMSGIPGAQGSEEYTEERARRRASGPTHLKDIFANSPLSIEKPKLDTLPGSVFR